MRIDTNAARWILGNTGPAIIILLVVLPVFWWAPYSSFANTSASLRSLGQISALTGSVLFCINFLLAARFRAVEHLFFGLPRIYITHHLYGAAGFTLLLFHPVFLTLSYLALSLESAAEFLLPSSGNLPVLLGELALLSLIVVLFITFFIPLEYDFWKKTHSWIGLPLAIAIIHAYIVDSTLSQSPPLKIYMFALLFLAAFSYVWRWVAKIITLGRYGYTVKSVRIRKSVTIVSMDPVRRKMNYLPGQFAFLVFDHLGIPRQSHPFSITSDPADNHLTFAVKSVGDFTETLKLLEPGTAVWVEGPYGRFSWKLYTNTKQVWIAGGIGVTPFLGMLSSLEKSIRCSINLYYCTRDHEEAVFDSELRWCEQEFPSVTYTPWFSKTHGRLTGKTIVSQVSDALSREFFLCGPPQMMHSIAKQLVAAGVKKSRIHSEEFSLQ